MPTKLERLEQRRKALDLAIKTAREAAQKRAIVTYERRIRQVIAAGVTPAEIDAVFNQLLQARSASKATAVPEQAHEQN